MFEPMLEPGTYAIEDFLSADNLALADGAVAEVFSMMLGIGIGAASQSCLFPDGNEVEDRTAIVGFSGVMRGSCQIRMDSVTARTITSAMLGGTPVEEGDDSIDDAVGELCNMLAGGWKNQVPELSSRCSLSPPTVISGSKYKVHLSKPSIRLTRSYEFDGHLLHLTLLRESLCA